MIISLSKLSGSYNDLDFCQTRIVEGETFEDSEHVVVSNQLKDIGVKIGDELKFKDLDETYIVSVFTENATFQTSPIVYMDLAEWLSFASSLSGMKGMRDETTASLDTEKAFSVDKLLAQETHECKKYVIISDKNRML